MCTRLIVLGRVDGVHACKPNASMREGFGTVPGMETVREIAYTKKGRSDRSIFHLKESSIMTNQLNLPRIGRFGALPSIKFR